MPGLVAKVLPSESDIRFDETWKAEGDGWAGTLDMTIAGAPVAQAAR